MTSTTSTILHGHYLTENQQSPCQVEQSPQIRRCMPNRMTDCPATGRDEVQLQQQHITQNGAKSHSRTLKKRPDFSADDEHSSLDQYPNSKFRKSHVHPSSENKSASQKLAPRLAHRSGRLPRKVVKNVSNIHRSGNNSRTNCAVVDEDVASLSSITSNQTQAQNADSASRPTIRNTLADTGENSMSALSASEMLRSAPPSAREAFRYVNTCPVARMPFASLKPHLSAAKTFEGARPKSASEAKMF